MPSDSAGSAGVAAGVAVGVSVGVPVGVPAGVSGGVSGGVAAGVSAEPVLARKAGLAVVDGDERVVILDLDRPADPPVVLADSARAVWDALDRPRAAADVVAEVAGWYGESVETVGPSVLGFIDGLVERGLLVVG